MYERFSMYRFAIDYPNTWRVEFDPKSRRAEGYVIFRSPNNDIVFLTWGMLESIRGKYDSLEAQAEASFARIANGRDVKKLNLIETKTIELNGHRAVYRHFVMERAVGMRMLKANSKEIWSIHLQCERTDRFFVVYESAPDTERSREQDLIFNHMVDSFVCH
jgi:hypothetical protein